MDKFIAVLLIYSIMQRKGRYSANGQFDVEQPGVQQYDL